MRYSNNSLRLGKRARVKRYIVRKRVIVPYGKELPSTGVKA